MTNGEGFEGEEAPKRLDYCQFHVRTLSWHALTYRQRKVWKRNPMNFLETRINGRKSDDMSSIVGVKFVQEWKACRVSLDVTTAGNTIKAIPSWSWKTSQSDSY